MAEQYSVLHAEAEECKQRLKQLKEKMEVAEATLAESQPIGYTWETNEFTYKLKLDQSKCTATKDEKLVNVKNLLTQLKEQNLLASLTTEELAGMLLKDMNLCERRHNDVYVDSKPR
jgi:hypothetical protein